ncbi:MAG: sensor histidine kinase [Thiobacillaceae bacterium]
MTLRLRPRLAILNAFLLALTTALLAAHFVVKRADNATQRLIQEATAHVETLAAGLAALAPSIDPAVREAVLLQAAGYPGLRELRLLGAEGQVLAHIRQRGVGPAIAIPPGGVLTAPSHAERSLKWQASGRMTERFSWDADRLVVWQSLRGLGAEGHLQMEISLEPVKQDLREGIVEGGLATLAAALAGAALMLIWLRRPVRAIRAATDQAARMSQSAGEKLASPRTGRELDALVAALNEASAGLQAQQQALVAAETRLQALFDTVAEALLIVDAEGKIERANRGAEALLAQTRQDLQGQALSTFLPDWTTAASDPDTSLRPLSYEAQDRHGRRFPVEVSVCGCQHGPLPCWVISLRDVSLRLQAEEQARTARAAAEAASQMKAAFLANISHELRTPLNAILGMTRLALETELSAQQHEYLLAVRDSGQRLLALVNNVLELSQLESGELATRPAAFPLRALFERTLRRLEPRSREKGLGLWLELADNLPDSIEADAERLQQVLLHLVDNAIKFTQAGGVTVSVDRRHCFEPHCLHVCVEDTGIGIPTERIGALFDPFSRVDGPGAPVQDGAGLGLALCGRLVEMLGGHIWVESQVGEGSRFHFTLRYTPVGVVPECLHPASELRTGRRPVPDTATTQPGRTPVGTTVAPSVEVEPLAQASRAAFSRSG